jgi:mono/diheme cytochrome c family protein
MRLWTLLPGLALCLPPPAAPAADFQRDIRPLLAKRCLACHGQDEHSRQANFRLDTRDGALGKTGGHAGIIPGDSARSRVIIRAQDPKRPMPPAGPRLTADEIDLLKKWIDAGAPYEKHWAFVKPARPAPPAVRDPRWPRNDIDRFVLARLEKEGLTPSPEADPHTLARRAALDLTGLPPEPSVLKAFLDDRSPKAYERLIDRLLASPAYGERWARVWLDLARYADTQGYEKDNRRTIWPYRDWVIRAFNDNLPFDRFTILQLAGDLLPNPSEADLVATGFHRNTMTNTEGGTDDEEFRDAAVKDRVAVTGQVWMGLTVGCAQCHTHKYDPISHREFYQLYAFFNQTEDNDKPDDSPTIKLGEVTTLVMRDLPADKQRRTRIHERGNFLNPGAEVAPAVLSAFHELPPDAPRNRLGLAQWLVSKENPLTARVTVNRLWARLFGTGLVESEEDFGTQGNLPSHPELLDWLATEFMRTDWDMKAILKTMAMSATYRQSSAVTPVLLEKDPRNRLLARGARFRLDAEVVRDQALAAGGLLSRKLYGPPVMPWQPEGIWMVVYNGESWITSDGEDRYRRGLYTFLRRTSPYPSMITYDAPTGELCTIRRIRTNTPLQALASLNDPVSMEAAQHLALRALREAGPDDTARATRLFELLLVRPPRAAELDRILQLHRKAAAELHGRAAEQFKLLHYDQFIYPRDREVVLVDDARGVAPEWRYTVDDPGEGWQSAHYDARAWKTGRGQFGWHPKMPAEWKVATNWESEFLWLRREFDATHPLEELKVLVRTAGAFEAYLNGVPAAASLLDRNGYYEYRVSPEGAAALKPGRNVLAVKASRIREKENGGQLMDLSLRGAIPLQPGAPTAEQASRAAWVVVANTLLNLDETLTRR